MIAPEKYNQVRELCDTRAPTRLARRLKTNRDAAKEQIAASRPLWDADLHAHAGERLHAAVSDLTVNKIPMSFWPSLKETCDGEAEATDWLGFAAELAQFGDMEVPKLHLPVFSPITISGRRRGVDSTLAIHALVLDADNVGAWDPLLTSLAATPLAYIAFETANHAVLVPKWRVLLPLNEPYPTPSPVEAREWRMKYLDCRILFGAVARLTGHGFDPTTGSPAHPWLPGTRRPNSMIPRQVYARGGRCLDLRRLLVGLPPMPQHLIPPLPKKKPSHGAASGLGHAGTACYRTGEE